MHKKTNPKKALNSVMQTGYQAQTTKKNNANSYISNMQLARIRQDVLNWRQSVGEAENAYLPYRYKMQQMYIDTILNGHVDACIKRRKNLTLMKKFDMVVGKNIDEYWTKIFKAKWFYETLNYILDAPLKGYSLVNWTDIKNDMPTGLQLIKRWNISPDRLTISSTPYSPIGQQFMEGELEPWTLYVSTPTENAASKCGYGLLYKVAYYEIFLRNLMGYNGDFVELYSQPYRVGKTTKTEGKERDAFVSSIQEMGSAAWAVIDPEDDINFIDSSQAGTGWRGYENLEQRCEKKISKILLGHADALDSTPGKLGGDQGGNSPAQEALSNIASEQNEFVMQVVNDLLLPKLRSLGLSIPDDMVLQYSNDDEMMEQRAREDMNNNTTATFVKTLKDAGYEVGAEWLSERTGGIPITKAAAPAIPSQENLKQSQVNKLRNLYGK